MSERVIGRIGSVTALAAVAAVSGCAGGSQHGVAGARKTLLHRCAAGAVRPVGSANVAWAAVVERPLTAFRSPGREPIARFGLLNVNGVPTVLGILGERVDASCRATWLHVALPLRPNGVTGWVRARKVAAGVRAHAHHRRSLGAPSAPLPAAEARADLARGRRLERDSDAARALLREPAARSRATPPARSALAPSVSRRSRRADRLGAGRPDRDPRDERAVVDRARRLERLHPPAEPGAAAPVQGRRSPARRC